MRSKLINRPRVGAPSASPWRGEAVLYLSVWSGRRWGSVVAPGNSAGLEFEPRSEGRVGMGVVLEEQDAATHNCIREVAGNGASGPADEWSKLAEPDSLGVISEEELQTEKAKVLG